jgi:NADH-quinone oxidoreductase subunit F
VTETRTAAQTATPRPTLSAATRDAIAAEVAKYPNFRTALLPALKLAQREVGWLPPQIAAEVADLVGVPHAAANELATFYSMLHTQPHGRLAVEVCVQLPCGFCGGERLLAQLERGLGLAAGEVRADGALSLHRTAECMGACHRAPMVRIGDHYVENLKTQADVDALCKELLQGRVPTTEGTRNHDCHPIPGGPVVGERVAGYAPVLLPRQPRTTQVTLAEYQAAGGYAGLRAALQKQPGDVIEIVKQSNLRGRGGAAFPAGLKWSFVPKGPGPKYLVVNADESEPGTFKDRELMEVESHMLLEGMAIASYAIGCTEAFLYLRGEYVEAGARMQRAIAAAEGAGLLGRNVLGSGFDLRIHVFLGAGAYICGEETALLESLEGRRPMPRSRPPFPAVAGLYGRPTVVNNVETICNVPHILARGVDWYKKLGPNEKSAGPKIFCLSGWVNRPGNYELPLGAATFRELIEQHGQGMRDGAKVKGVLPAGISAPIVPADKLDTRLDYESVAAAGSMLGSASLIVIPEDVSIVRAAVRMLEFFRHESCGKCTPCREGTMWLHKILLRLEQGRGGPEDLDLLVSLCGQISGKVLCALGDFATSPVTATIKHYRPEFLRAIERGADGKAPGARDAQGTSDWSRRG